MKKIVACLISLSLLTFAAPPAEAKRMCRAVEGYDVTVCVVISDGTGTAKARIFQSGEDVFGVISVGVSTTFNKKKGRFPTPLSSFKHPRTPLCTVERVPKSKKVCADRKLAAGLQNVTAFDSEYGVFAVHYYPTIGESHGCVRMGWDASEFVQLAAETGTVALVVLDIR